MSKPFTTLNPSIEHRLAAWEQEKDTALPAASLDGTSGPIGLFLGPEGGLHAEDLHILQQWRFTTFSLGPRILRGETAALAAMSIIQYCTGALQPSSVDRATTNLTIPA